MFENAKILKVAVLSGLFICGMILGIVKDIISMLLATSSALLLLSLQVLTNEKK